MSISFNISFCRTKHLLLSHGKALIRYYSGTQKNVKTRQYTDTILLPQTNFPSKLTGQKKIEMSEYLAEVNIVKNIFVLYFYLYILNLFFYFRNVDFMNCIIGKD